MAVYFKFKSAKDFDSVPIDGHFISVGYLKEKIFESKHLGRGTDFDLMVSNAQTNEGPVLSLLLLAIFTSYNPYLFIVTIIRAQRKCLHFMLIELCLNYINLTSNN